MVVAAHPLAVEAGLAVLKAGGNAVDAAVATAFALNAAEPFASGLGGGGFMVIHLAADRRTTVINYREKAPAASTPGMFLEKGEEAGRWRTADRPRRRRPRRAGGLGAGPEKIRDTVARRGRPAGRSISPSAGSRSAPPSAGSTTTNSKSCPETPDEGTCYLNQGLPYEPGERFRNPELAATFRTLAEKGASEFYTGGIARKIVDAVRAHRRRHDA